MASPDRNPRERTLRLPAAADAASLQRLEEALRRLEAVENVHVAAGLCRVRYRFPELTFADIWPLIRDSAGFSPLARLRHGLAAILEDNERDHVTRPDGWHRRLAGMHARRFDPPHEGGRRPGTTR